MAASGFGKAPKGLQLAADICWTPMDPPTDSGHWEQNKKDRQDKIRMRLR